MPKTRIEIIEEADGRWPNYHSESHYRLSGGFIEGATWLQENPTATGEEYRQETERRFPLTPGDDGATRVVNSEFKEGFIYGVAWMRQVLNSENN